VKNGNVHVPTAPGLGVKVDTVKLAKYRTELLE
jgi:L-alanine-DL-glutamate epimerase-like enolase superfamily enzyme